MAKTPLIECVPNFSEGRDPKIIARIAEAMSSVRGAKVLHKDMGYSAHRTVITVLGAPDAVVESAFRGIRAAAELIDMTAHQGVHSRLGAADVVPLVPVQGIALAEVVPLARELATRVGNELELPVYLYAAAAEHSERRELSAVRAGEYEGLAARLLTPEGKPDRGPQAFVPRFGATAIGARGYLVAFNVNLNTRSRKIAQEIALAIREQGRPLRDAQGLIVRDAEGRAVQVPGRLPGVRAIGWYIEEYECAQVSCNLLDTTRSGMHDVIEACREEAQRLGVTVTGSELIGLVPRAALFDAGAHYLRRQGASAGEPRSRVLSTAVQSLGLDARGPFNLEERVLEAHYEVQPQWLHAPFQRFLDDLSSQDPTPGGGSAAAIAATLGASLVAMVGNLSVQRGARPEHRAACERLALEANALSAECAADVPRDIAAFQGFLAAPKDLKSDSARAARLAAVATAAEVPLGLLARAQSIIALATEVLVVGNPHAASDARAAAALALAAAECAALNVEANLPALRALDAARAEAMSSTLCTRRTKVRLDARALLEPDAAGGGAGEHGRS